jgi:hypothetical protein
MATRRKLAQGKFHHHKYFEKLVDVRVLPPPPLEL